VGKTTLAVHLAHEMSGRYPDGPLFVNLGGFDPSGSVVDRADALRGFLEALGVAPASMPRTLAKTVTRYRSLLADRRVLVVVPGTQRRGAPAVPARRRHAGRPGHRPGHGGGTDGELRAALARLLEHYRRSALAAQRLYTPRCAVPFAENRPEADTEGLPDRTRRDWFTAERPALLAAVPAAATNGPAAHAWQTMRSVMPFPHRNGQVRLRRRSADRSGSRGGLR
jgi:hypothetical protein